MPVRLYVINCLLVKYRTCIGIVIKEIFYFVARITNVEINACANIREHNMNTKRFPL